MTDRAGQKEDENKKNVETLFETFNRGDLGSIDGLVGPEYVGAQGDRGPAGFRTVVVGLRNAFPDLHYTIDDLLAVGDQVAIRWHWTGTHKAPFRAFAATGKPVSNTGMGIFRLRDGKVVEAVLETDRLGFLEQIGAVPANVGRGPQPPAAPHP
jgi:predicted ester cyclase